MENENRTEDSIGTGTFKQWMQDNLRIILSIIIVILIAGGIYSYSKRTAVPSVDQSSNQEAIIDQNATNDTVQQPSDTNTKQVTNAATSQETTGSFIETAGKGDSSTVLARRALANYLEKNPDSTLTAEHKIYIEDFLRKNIPQKRVSVGTSAEFSKDLIQKAITQAKTLSGGQLKNLHKYAVRVPSLS
jgi:hypothetical protein